MSSAVKATPLTKEEVYSAFEELVKQGKRPTTGPAHLILDARGSLGTVSKHLKSWRIENAEKLSSLNVQKEIELPEGIVEHITTVAKKMWRAAEQEASGKVTLAQQEKEKGIKEAEADKDEMTAIADAANETKAQMENQLADTQAQLIEATARNKQLEGDLQDTRVELSTAHNKVEELHKTADKLKDESLDKGKQLAFQQAQLQEKDKEIKRLETQLNQQRQDSQTAADTSEKRYTAELERLTATHAEATAELKTQQAEQLATIQQQAQTEREQLQAQLEKLDAELKETRTQSTEQAQQLATQAEALGAAQAKHENAELGLIAAQKQIAKLEADLKKKGK